MKRQIFLEMKKALEEGRQVFLTFDMAGQCALQEDGRTLLGDENLPIGGRGLFSKEGREFFTLKAAAQRTVVICGAGHVAYYVAQMAHMLDYQTIVIDDRPEFANRERFPQGTILQEPFETALEKVPYNGDTCFVIVTRGHQGDSLCLERILDKGNFGYLGMIGSRKKVGLVIEDMRSKGFSEELLRQVHSPIGLDIGAETPAEIAVSIFAEIIQSCGTGGYWGEDLLAHADQAKALAVIVDQRGSAPRGPGAALVVDGEGRAYGTIGGGSAEKLAIEEAARFPKTGLDRTYIMTNGEAGNTGMVCGGEIRVLIAPVED